MEFQRTEPPTEDEDIWLYGNAYTTKDGQRLDPMRMMVEAKRDKESGKLIVTRYLYTLASGRQIVIAADEVIMRERRSPTPPDASAGS